MSRPFLRCYENGCMNFAVDFLYRKHETKKYLRSNFSTAKLKLRNFFHITDYLFWNRGARNRDVLCDSEDDGEERVNAETKIEG